MKRQWNILREAVERPDAQGRWDQAYQSLLRWSLENERGHGRARAEQAALGEYDVRHGLHVEPLLVPRSLHLGEEGPQAVHQGEGYAGQYVEFLIDQAETHVPDGHN